LQKEGVDRWQWRLTASGGGDISTAGNRVS
jgi:hypothetical protein